MLGYSCKAKRALFHSPSLSQVSLQFHNTLMNYEPRLIYKVSLCAVKVVVVEEKRYTQYLTNLFCVWDDMIWYDQYAVPLHRRLFCKKEAPFSSWNKKSKRSLANRDTFTKQQRNIIEKRVLLLLLCYYMQSKESKED